MGLFSLSAASAATLPDSLKEQLEASMAEKASRTPEQKKLDSRLVLLIRQQAQDTSSMSVPVPHQSDLHPLVSADGLAAVEIKAEVSDELVAAITLEGGHIRSRAPKYDLLEADVPLMALGALVERRDVRFIKPLLPPSHNQAQAQPVSALHVAAEAMIAHAIAEARARFGVTGRGVKIGVISDSVDYLEQSQANGALPDVVVLESGTGAGEGTAMLEVVHAIAPDAELYFAAGLNRLIEAVENLAAAGVDIIIDDITQGGAAPFQADETGLAVQAAVNNGVLYFSSAGNVGREAAGTSTVYEADFLPADVSIAGFPGDVHTFPTDNVVNTAFASGDVCLFWSDPLGASTNDYDLFILDSNFQLVSQSTNHQIGAQDPIECVDGVLEGQNVMIYRASGEARFLHLAMVGNGAQRPAFAYTTAGAVRGHQALEEVFAVGAANVNGRTVPFDGDTEVASYSGDGFRRWFFQPDGTPLTPGDFSSSGGVVRLKPDITAAAGMNTTVSDLFAPFFGTSAAAPVAGAIAALMLELDPKLSLEEIRHIFAETAIDIAAPGPDADSGYGIIMAPAVLEYLSPSRSVPIGGGVFLMLMIAGVVRSALRARG